MELRNDRLTGFDRFYAASLFFYCFLLFAPTVYALFPVAGLIANAVRLFIAAVLTVYTLRQALVRGSVWVNRGLLLITFLFILLSLLPTAYYQTTYMLFNQFISFYLVYMFFLFYRKKHLLPVVNAATVFMFVMLGLSITGFVYAFLGGAPLMSGVTGEGRAYYLYLTTGAVDNGVFGNIIRPQGIYEEPGSFSFVICVLCFLRVLMKKSDRVTFAIMLLGNITFSMTHIMIFALFILHLAVKYGLKKKFTLYVAAAAALMLLAYMPVSGPVNELLFGRFALSEATGHIVGGNRITFFKSSVEVVKTDSNVLLWGIPRNEDGVSIMETVWIYDGNPLTPLLEFGIFIAWLYYFYLMFFAVCGLIDRKNFLIYLSVLLMLMQKPEFYRGGPTAGVLILFLTSWAIVEQRMKKRGGTACPQSQ